MRSRAVSDPHITQLDHDDLLSRRVLREQVRGIDLRERRGRGAVELRLSEKRLHLSWIRRHRCLIAGSRRHSDLGAR